MEPVEIIGDGLVLRPWRAEDVEDVYRACQDPDIQRWTAAPVPYLHEHAVEFVTGTAPQGWATGTGALFAVRDATTGELNGLCGLVSIDSGLKSAELGFWTVPEARGRGVAVRATRAVTRWAFEELGLRRIIWQSEVGNHASRLVALRAGFRIEGRLRLAAPHPSGSSDGWVGSLLPGDLPAPPGDRAAAPSGVRPGQPRQDDRQPARQDEPGPAAPGTWVARRAAVFGAPQPDLFATSADGDELRLRPLRDLDVEAIVTACRNPETIRWTTVPDPYQRSDAEFFVHEYGPSTWARGTGALFAIADKTDAYAGVIELRLSPTDPAVGDLGFVVAPHARGRGYCPAALAALCVWGFTTLGLARIEWRANVGNESSRRAAEKAGFVIEGTARHGLDHRGTRTDAWVGALLPADLGVLAAGGGDPGAAGR